MAKGLKEISMLRRTTARSALIAEDIVRNIPDDVNSAWLETYLERLEDQQRSAIDSFLEWNGEIVTILSEQQHRLIKLKAAELEAEED